MKEPDSATIRRLAQHALAAFEDLARDSAVEMVLWDLCEILAHVTDDPVSVSLVQRIETQINSKDFVGH